MMNVPVAYLNVYKFASHGATPDDVICEREIGKRTILSQLLKIKYLINKKNLLNYLKMLFK
jgi:hypothetical protein